MQDQNYYDNKMKRPILQMKTLFEVFLSKKLVNQNEKLPISVRVHMHIYILKMIEN